MPNSPFIAIETANGIVQKVEGQFSSWGPILGNSLIIMNGQGITEALNQCARAGYELFDTDVIGDKKIYRLKLKTK